MPRVEKAEVTVTVHQSNHLGKDGYDHVVQLPGEHVPEGTAILEAVSVHGFSEDPVVVRAQPLFVLQQPVNVAHKYAIERGGVWRRRQRGGGRKEEGGGGREEEGGG